MLSTVVREPLRFRDVTEHLRHIALIPDGNRRWAKLRGQAPEVGHRRAMFEVIPELLEGAWRGGLHTFTLWLFSTENWRRDDAEVGSLMGIYRQGLDQLLPLAQRLDVRMVHLGRKDRLPTELLQTVLQVESETAGHAARIFNFGIDYGGRDELLRAVNRLRRASPPGPVDASALEAALDTGGQPHPNPDLTIRTAGDCRLSGLMPWQTGYSELYFSDQYFPDFDWASLERAALEFNRRKRSYGA